MKNLLIIGHGGHGKDEVANLLAMRGVKSISSSWAALELCVWPALGCFYSTKEDCFADRRNHRDQWFTLIREYEEKHNGALADYIYHRSDCYIGIRSRASFEEVLAKYKPFVIWVDRSLNVKPEPSTSMELTAVDAHYVINNNGSLGDLRQEVKRMWYGTIEPSAKHHG